MMKSASCSPHSTEGSDPSNLELREARKLLALGLAPTNEPALGSGMVFGDYELGEELGRGSSCIVYRARHAGVHRIVALKLMRGAEFATPRELQRFRNGATAAAELDHPHIVPVFHVGERDGRPFFTMRLFEGGNLHDALPRFRASPELAARMLAKVARAVHFAHQHGVLHRDLKPANIVLDEHGEPHVADFGLAKRLNEHDIASHSSAIVGTLDYMAPEQAKAAAALTPAADIFALGVILYELLTGHVPLPDHSFVAKLRWLSSDEPVCPAREADPEVDRNLENICLRCLQKNPSKRYRSGDELAAALERASRPGEADEPPPPLAQRLESWVRRHPRRSAILACLAVVSAIASLGGWWIWRKSERVLRDTLETNAFIAGSQAGAALSQLREYAELVSQTAHEPAIVNLVQRGQVVHPAFELRALANRVDTLAVFDNEARVLAEWPPPLPAIYQRKFAFRDYFQGARALAEHHLPGAYLTRAFRSETGERGLAFSFSTPVLDEHGVAIGVVIASLAAKSVFGAVKMEDSPHGRHITSALIGPRGPDRDTPADAPPSSAFMFLAHPGLPHGHEYTVASPYSSTLQARFGPSAPAGKQFALRYVPPVKIADYRDAVPGFDGSWVAAFAPVGNTGFVVLVQTRREATLTWH